MKNICGITGVLLVWLAPEIKFLEYGLATAVLFLGGCLCAGALTLAVWPFLESVVAEQHMVFYRNEAERFIEQQQKLIQKAADEAMQRKQSRRSGD